MVERRHRGRHHIVGRRRHRRQGASRAGRFPLSEAWVDERVRLVNVFAGRRLLRRLADLGLTPGTEMTVRRAAGPLVLALGEGLIALGRSAAQSLIVERVDGEE